MVHILSRYKHSSYLHQESHTNHLRLLIYSVHFLSLYVKFYPEATTLAVNIVKTRFPNLNPWGWEIHHLNAVQCDILFQHQIRDEVNNLVIFLQDLGTCNHV
jgi:hypothetical protein